MAQRDLGEIIAGAVVLLAAAGFLAYALTTTAAGESGGYTLHATFSSIAGLTDGADVRVSGVKVGQVTSEKLDPETFQAKVAFTVAEAIKLPKDSSASIVSDGLLGGKYVSLQPGGDSAMIPPGGSVTITEGSVNIEQLVGKYIFGGAGGAGSGGAGSGGAASGSGGAGGSGDAAGSGASRAGAGGGGGP
jgi:phospholipid/cholesterol/gamma-HCH transport system substrate-binding protein